MNILITGSSGFIGGALVHRLRGRHKIVAIDKVIPHPEGVSLAYQVDISDRESLLRVMKDTKAELGGRLDFVFHLAAHYEFSNLPDSLYEEVNERGTINLLEALSGMEVGTFVFTSSTAVMKGHVCNDWNSAVPSLLDEDSPTGSPLYYGRSKLKAEGLLQAHKHRFRIVIVRLSGVYSSYCQLIPLANQIASIYRRELGSRFLPAGGKGCISYVHLEDVLDGFERIMDPAEEIPSGTVYIFSEEDYLPYGELYRIIFRALYGTTAGTVSLPFWVLLGGVYATNYLYSFLGKGCFFKPWMVDFSRIIFTFSTEKARRELGWRPRHSFRECLGEMLERLKADPKEWMRRNRLMDNVQGG
jgi:nucleoside-diphosphate-sugar epimerase